MTEFKTVVSANIISNFKQAPRYKGDFLAFLLEQLLNPLVFILFIPLLDINLLETQVGTSNILAFLIIGFAVSLFNRVAMYHLAAEVRALLFGGQLEYLFSLPLSKYKYLFGVATGLCIWYCFPGIPMLFLGIILAAPADIIIVIIVILVVLLQIYLLINIGVLLSLLVLKEKSVDSILAVVGILVNLISGAIIPIQAFPSSIQALALLFPPTIGLDCVRVILFDSIPILQSILPSINNFECSLIYITIMIIESILFTVLARKITKIMVNKALEDGLRYF